MAYLDIAGLEYFWSKIKSAFSAIGHTHDERYYTESEMDLKLLGKSDTSHNHDDSYLKLGGGSIAGDLQVKGVTTLKNTVTITGDCSVDESHNFIGNLNGNASTATNANYATKADSANVATNASSAFLLSGFAYATGGQTWGNQTGAFVHGEDDSAGGSFAFRKDNPIAGQLSMIIDGRFYQNEGRYRVLDESDISSIRSRSDMELGVPLSCATRSDNTAPWAGAHDGSLDFAQCRSMIGTVCDDNGSWFNVLSIRHRNGSGDGTSYGLLAFSDMNNLGDTIWYQKQSGSWTGMRNILDSSNYGSYALPLSGGTMTGDIAFASIGDVAASPAISWNGSTDGADIYYQTTGADQGNLVLNLRDDDNCYLRIAQNGNYKSYFSPSDGNFHGNVNGNADTAGVAARLGDSGNVKDPITFYDTGLDDTSPTWFWGSWGEGYAYRYYTSKLSVNYANSAGSATKWNGCSIRNNHNTSDTWIPVWCDSCMDYVLKSEIAAEAVTYASSGAVRIGRFQICFGSYHASIDTTITYELAFTTVLGAYVSPSSYVGWHGPYVYNVGTTSMNVSSADGNPNVYWMVLGYWW